MDKLNDIIFKLNTIIISALDKNSNIYNELVHENENLSSCVRNDLADSYKNILNGGTFQVPEPEEPSLAMAVLYLQEKRLPFAFYEFVRLSKQNPNDLRYIKGAARCLERMKSYKVLLKHFMPIFTKYLDTDLEMLELAAVTYFGLPEFYEKSISLYEKLLKVHKKTKFDYNIRLSLLYERVYQDKKLKTQIKYALNALKMNEKSNIANSFLAKLYYRAGMISECEKYFNQVLSNNPTADEMVSYSRYLMKEGRIKEGYDRYRIRFDTGRITYPKPLTNDKRWDGVKDISNATVIVHYEQGFGDSIMFSRYIPLLSTMAKKIIFVVQKNLIPIFKSSGYENYCTLLSHEADVNPDIKLNCINQSVMYSKGEGMGKIPHDYHIPLMDLPYLINESPARMTEAGGYLIADNIKIEEFREKYIHKNDKLKIGIAFHGTKQSKVTYRDIPVTKFLPLFNMKGVEFYSFQADEYMNELEELPSELKIYNLGKEFKDFEDTACALNCMDLLISTDNVVMNLAGAMGIKTYCLFNVFTESRWYKTTGENIGWYKSVKPFKAKTFNDWDNLILKVKKQMSKDFSILKNYR